MFIIGDQIIQYVGTILNTMLENVSTARLQDVTKDMHVVFLCTCQKETYKDR